MALRSKSTARIPGRLIAVSLATATATALLLSACSSAAPEASGTDGPSVDVGVVAPFGQGTNAALADGQFEGMKLGAKYVAEHGGLYNKGTINFVQATSNGQPAMVATSVRKLLTDGVKLILGPNLTADCLGAAPLIDQAGAVAIMDCSTTSLTGPDRVPRNQYRFDTNDKMTSTALALKVAEKFKDVESIDYVAYDYLQGHEGVDVFKARLKAEGVNPKTDHEFFVPAATTNYSSQIGALSQTPKDGKKRILVLLTWGAGYLNFIQQAAPLKLLENYEAVLTTSMYYQSAVALKGAAPEVYNAFGTCDVSMWKNDKMDWLVKETKKQYNKLPDDWTVAGFSNLLFLADAINKAKSTDSVKVDKALSTLKSDGPNGAVTMDPKTHQAERKTPVCATVGDPKAPQGVKLLNSAVFDWKEVNG